MASFPKNDENENTSDDTATTATTNKDNYKKKKIKHKGTINKPSPQGHDYEINILILTYLDAMKKKRKNLDDFYPYIATEVLDTSPFEDIVYVQVHQNEATSYYVQAKHSLKQFPIKLDELFTESTKRDKISLLKYFECLGQIKKKIEEKSSYHTKIKEKTKFIHESHKFIIFTNRSLHEEVKGLQDVTEDILFYTKTSRKGNLCKVKISNDPDSIYQIMKSKLEDATDEQITEFFDEIVFATEQPDVDKLKQLVEEELRVITGLRETKWIASTLAAELSQWAHQKDGWFLDKNTDLFEYIDQHSASWRQTVSTLNYLDNIKKHRVYFRDDVKESVVRQITEFLHHMNENEPRMCIVYYEYFELTEIKIAQAISDKIKFDVMFINLENINFDIFDHADSEISAHKYLKSVERNILLVTVKSDTKVEDFLYIVTKMFEKSSYKKIIFLAPSIFSNERVTIDYRYIKDIENSLFDLNKESREKVYRERRVLFEGHQLNLRLLIDENFENKINGHLLAQIIREDVVFEITQTVDKYERDNIEEFYIPRQLRRIRISEKILEGHFYITDGLEFNKNEINDQDVILITENKDVSVFDKICTENQNINIHWIVQEKQGLYWVKSQGILTHNIRNYLDNISGSDADHSRSTLSVLLPKKSILKRRKSESLSSSTASVQKRVPRVKFCDDDYIKNDMIPIQNIDSRIIVIAAEPGMGKSTVLSNLYRAVKSTKEYKEDTLLLLKTSLEIHSTQFKKLSKNKVTLEGAIEFLITILNIGDNENIKLLNVDERGQLRLSSNENINGWNALTFNLFAHFYNENKIIVLLDGFDETAPEYSDQVLNLLEALTKTKVRKIIVTTRPYGVASELECRLNTFAYSLVPFSLRDQRNFLHKYWKYKLGLMKVIEETKLNLFIEECETILFTNYFDMDNVFTSTPQHIEMVATVYQKYFREYLETGVCENMSKYLNIYSLYEEFFEIKFGILHQDAYSDKCKEKIAYSKLRKITKKEHGQLALMELFDEEKLEEILPEETRFDLMEAVKDANEKTGIIYADRNGHPRFIHRTFAEYFTADYLVDMLQQKKTKQIEKVRNFLYEMVLEPLSPFKVVFNFLNYKLAAQSEYKDIFFAALNGNWSKINEIDNIDDIRDSFNRTPLHLCFYGATESYSSLSSKYNRKLYIKDSLFNWNALHYLALNDNSNNFRFPVSISSEVSKNPKVLQDTKGKTPFMLAMECQSRAIIILTDEISFSHGLKDCNGNTSLHYFASKCNMPGRSVYRRLLKFFLCSGANFFEPNAQSKSPFMMMLENEVFYDYIYLLIKHHRLSLYEFKTQSINEIFVNNLIRHAKLQDCNGKTILHYAVDADRYYDVGATAFFLKYPSVVDGINLQDRDGKTALHYALNYDSKSCIHAISLLLKNGTDVTIKDNEGNAPIQILFDKMCTVEFNYSNELEIFASLPLNVIDGICQINFNTEKLMWEKSKLRHFIINLSDKNGKTVLHYAVLSGNLEKISIILKYEPNLYIKDNEGNIPADGLFENDGVLEMFNTQLSLREQFDVLLISMGNTENKEKLSLALSRYRNITYYLRERNAINDSGKDFM